MPRSFSPRIFLALHRPQERSLECYFRRPRFCRDPSTVPSVFLWVECLLFRTSLLRASLLARLYLARNSGTGYTREFHSGTYEAPFSTRSELWWSIFRLPFSPRAQYPSTFICAHTVVSEPRKSTTKVAVPPELDRLKHGSTARGCITTEIQDSLYAPRWRRESSPRCRSSGIYI